MIKLIKKIFNNPLFYGIKISFDNRKLEKIYKNVSIGNMSIVKNTKLGEYTTIKNENIITNSNIGNYTYISHACNINYTEIGKFCSIGQNLKCGLGKHPTFFVSTHPIFFSTSKQCKITFSDKNYYKEREKIIIGNDVWIGTNVTILDGIKIGDGAIIGACSLITKDVEPYSIVGGVPAKKIKYRFTETEIKKLLKSKWWNKDIKWIEKNYKSFHKISDFIDIIK